MVNRAVWRHRLWAASSYVPATPAWRRYRRTSAWLDDASKLVQASLPGMPPIPPLVRSPIAVEYCVQSMLAVLQGIAARDRGATGAEAAAVIAEHAPVLLRQ